MFTELKNKIVESNKIMIFHHERPDGDAMFSSLGLYHFLKDNFPNKDIKMCGEGVYEVITYFDKYDVNELKDATVIVLDTSNLERIDGKHIKDANYIIKIDHHPPLDQYGDYNYVEENAGACAQVVAKILFSDSFKEFNISKKVCEYLYCGIVTDTINFRTSSTSYQTFEIATKLIKKGDLKVSKLVEYALDVNIDTFQKTTKIRTYLKIQDKFGYITLDNEDLLEIGIDGITAKNQIKTFSEISDLNIWAFSVENDSHLYDVSLRSKSGYIVNDLASLYGGGGHENAAGIKNMSKDNLKNLYKALIERSTK